MSDEELPPGEPLEHPPLPTWDDLITTLGLQSHEWAHHLLSKAENAPWEEVAEVWSGLPAGTGVNNGRNILAMADGAVEDAYFLGVKEGRVMTLNGLHVNLVLSNPTPGLSILPSWETTVRSEACYAIRAGTRWKGYKGEMLIETVLSNWRLPLPPWNISWDSVTMMRTC